MAQKTGKKCSYIMSQIKPVSKIERIPECLKHYNMRHQPKGIFGNPDFANKSKKVALFVDGCFWHGCPIHFKLPKTNSDFWKNKLEHNAERDKEVNERLKEEGWSVFRIWEHDIKKMK